MCMEFTDLNASCHNDPYLLLDMHRLIDKSSGCHMLIFMKAYAKYNHIRMNPLDAPKTTFMSNHDNYYFNVMLFGLKNSDATYQRLMDAFLVHQIRKNLEVYFDNMIFKTMERHSHVVDLHDILQLVKKYDMRLNPAKCFFGVQGEIFWVLCRIGYGLSLSIQVSGGR